MTNYVTHYTARYKVRYSAGGLNHTQIWRIGNPADIAVQTAVATAVENFYAGLAPTLSNDFAILGAEVAQANQTFFLPASVTPEAPLPGDLNASVIDDGWRPVFARWSYKTLLGNMGSVVMYGLVINIASTSAQDYRITPGEEETIDAGSAALQAYGGFRGPDNQPVFWRPYVNVGVDAGWQRRIRG